MKKTKFFKSLLVAAGLCVGASAWADATSIYERGTTTAWAATDISNTEWVANGSTASISSGLAISGGNGDNSIAKSISTKDGSKLVFTATWNTGSSTGNDGNYNYLRFGDVELQAWGQAQNSVIVIGGVSTTLASGVKADVRDNASWTVSITIDKAKGNVSYDITLPSSGKKTGTGTLASTDFSSISMGFHKGGRTNSNNSTLTSIEITEEEQDLTTASYTIKFLCGETVVKDEVTRSGVVGDPIVLTDADKASVIKDGNKYIYASDDINGRTIAKDVVVTVNFTKASKYTYSLNAVDGDNNLLKVLASGEQFEGEDATVYFNKAIYVNEKWYITTYTGNWVFHEATNQDILFTEDATISYFFEVEDINKSHSWAATGQYPDRYSNGKAGRLYQGSYAYTDALEGGVYTVTLWGRNNASSSNAGIGVYVRDAEGNETKCHNQLTEWAAGGGQGEKSIMIEIPDGYSLELKNESDQYNSNLEMDYLILRKSGINSMSIVGFTPESGLNDTDKWDPAKGFAMTRDADDPSIWTAVVENYVITGSSDYELKYYYKAAANGTFDGYQLPATGNQNYNFNWADGTKGAGLYKLTFTANTFANTVGLEIEKLPTATVYFINTNGWNAENIKIWAWDTNNGDYNYTGGTWPGQTMTATGEQIDGKDVYSWSTYVLNPTPTTLIISNNGSDTERTYNQPFVNGATYKADGSIASVSKAITAAGYATYCSPYALDFTGSALTAYVASKGADNKVTFSTITKVPANTGILLKGNAGTYAINTTTGDTDPVTDNALVGVLVDTEVPAGSFVLLKGTSGVGFYRALNAFTVSANTAYIEKLGDGARTFIGFNLDESTGIDGIAVEKMSNGEVYNLQGQRVTKAQKGLYIINGKKVLVK